MPGAAIKLVRWVIHVCLLIPQGGPPFEPPPPRIYARARSMPLAAMVPVTLSTVLVHPTPFAQWLTLETMCCRFPAYHPGCLCGQD